MYYDSMAGDLGDSVNPLEIFQQYWIKWLG